MNDEQKELIRGFYIHATANRYGGRTAKRMSRGLKRLFEYLAERGLQLEELKPTDALGYQGFLVEEGREDGKPYAEGSILGFLKGARAFFEYLQSARKVFSNPFKAVKPIKVPKKIPANMLKEKEMSGLLDRLKHFDGGKSVRERVRKYRTHVIAELQYATGLRIEEVAKLTPRDIDFERGVVTVEEGKGGRKRVCFLNEYAKEVLRLYADEFYGLIFNRLSNTSLLFGAATDALMKPVNRELKKACRELNVHPITSHGFRHSLGVHLLRSGCDIRHIAEILGHERLHSTEVYTQVDKEDLKSVLDRFHPRRFRAKP